MNKLFLILIMILMIPGVLAVPPESNPTQQSTQASTLNIIYPTALHFPVDKTFEIHFHIYNSTGSLVTLDQGEFCTIHIYNSTNNHIVSQNLTIDSNGVDYHTTDLTFSTKGQYSFVVFCDTALEDGFVASEITITEDGQNHESTGSYVLVGILIIGSIYLLFEFAGSLSGEEEWTQPLKILIYFIGLFMLVASLGFGLQILKYTSIFSGSVITVFIWIYIASLFVVVPVLLLFLVRFIVELLKFLEGLQGNSGGGWKK